MSNEPSNNGRRYIVMDIVFHASSLNYDQGGSNYQELKKITKWDGKQYILVSRYALRYSILHWANKLFPDKWKLARNGELNLAGEGSNKVVQPKKGLLVNDKNIPNDKKNILDYPEFDLFGFMITDQSKAYTRVAPVKISHAISLTPYNYDSQFMANLDMMKRAGGTGSNPVTIEEKTDFYVYNITIDVDRIGKYPEEERGENKKDNRGDKKDNKTLEKCKDKNWEAVKKRICQLVDTVFNLKREIKGRMEDLSPWLLICGLYTNGRYNTYLDKIELAKSHIYQVKLKEKETTDDEGRKREIGHEIIEKNPPKFIIDIDTTMTEQVDKLDSIKKKIEDFLGQNNQATPILIYKRKSIQTEPDFK